jgi:hypothetical protein
LGQRLLKRRFKMPQSIKEYLDQVRASGGTPTFTNIGGENPMLQPGPGRPMGGTQVPGAYMIEEPGGNPMMRPDGQVTPAPEQGPAIPERGAEEDMMTMSPVALANKAVDKMQPEIYKRLGIAPGTPLTDAQRVMIQKSTTSMRNGLTDHYKHQQDMASKAKEEEAKKMQDQTLTVKDKARMYNEFRKDYAEMANDPMQNQNLTESADEYARRMLAETESAVGGGGQAGALPGRDQAQGQGVYDQQLGGMNMGPMPGGQRMPNRDEFQRAANALFAQHGRDEAGKKIVFAELQKQFPGIFDGPGQFQQ